MEDCARVDLNASHLKLKAELRRLGIGKGLCRHSMMSNKYHGTKVYWDIPVSLLTSRSNDNGLLPSWYTPPLPIHSLPSTTSRVSSVASDLH